MLTLFIPHTLYSRTFSLLEYAQGLVSRLRNARPHFSTRVSLLLHYLLLGFGQIDLDCHQCHIHSLGGLEFVCPILVMRGYFVVEGVCILQLEQFLAEEVDFLFLLVELELLFSE